MCNKIWVLTFECNEYDQQGEYFIAVFRNEPTEADLAAYGYNHFGRKDYEWSWVTKTLVDVN